MRQILDRALRGVNLSLACVLCACASAPRPVPAGLDNIWPTSLGNERRAAYENESIPDTLRIAWDINAGSGMKAGVLVSDSAVFTGTTNRQLLAFGTRTGRKFWDQRLEGEIAGDLVRSGRTIFLLTGEANGRVHARDMERGHGVWRRSVGPNSYGPIVSGEFIFAGTDRGEVFALRATNGEELWRKRVRGSLATLPVDDRDCIIVATTSDSLYRMRKADGEIVARGTLQRAPSAAPAMAGAVLIVPQYSGEVVAVDATSLKELWRVDTGASVLAAPVAGADGVIHVLNRNAEIWQIRGGRATRVAALGGAAAGSFTLARNRYVVGKLDGTLQITDLSGRVISQFKFNDSIPAAVAVQAGALYVPFTHGRLVKID